MFSARYCNVSSYLPCSRFSSNYKYTKDVTNSGSFHSLKCQLKSRMTFITMRYLSEKLRNTQNVVSYFFANFYFAVFFPTMPAPLYVKQLAVGFKGGANVLPNVNMSYLRLKRWQVVGRHERSWARREPRMKQTWRVTRVSRYAQILPVKWGFHASQFGNVFEL